MFHRLLLSFCLLAISFQTVVGAVIVRCTENDGTSRLEWGCKCDATPAACVDTPVGLSASIVRPDSRANLAPPAPDFIAGSFFFDNAPPSVLTRSVEPHIAASPPAFAYCQSIVMLI